MKPYLLCAAVALSSILLTACGGEMDHDHMMMHETNGTVKKMDISFETNPQSLAVNQEGTLKANVSAGGKPVSDATVEIETWADGDNNHETTKGKSDKQGGYTVQKKFNKAGKYHATVHVTTSELHQMPTFEFTVE
ncbi:FixH family protein [Tumebacillus flagellatus]|nr:FixH family protein [Tumebacillus flagellatus]